MKTLNFKLWETEDKQKRRLYFSSSTKIWIEPKDEFSSTFQAKIYGQLDELEFDRFEDLMRDLGIDFFELSFDNVVDELKKKDK